VKIGNFDLAASHRPMVVCELAAAHNGSLETACKLIEIAADAGADAIKTQAYLAETITGDFDRPEFTIHEGPWAGHKLADLYRQAHTPREWFPTLIACAESRNIPIFPSVFSLEDIEFVKQFNPPAMKIASFELVDPILIKAAMWGDKPLVLSTGMASCGPIHPSGCTAFPCIRRRWKNSISASWTCSAASSMMSACPITRSAPRLE
jgi:sialic acid synthase SpsE